MLKILATWLLFILVLFLISKGLRRLAGTGSSLSSRRYGGWLTGLFIVGAVPLGFSLYTVIFDERLDANIGLGLAMLFAWAYCALLLCAALVIWGMYTYKRAKKN
ncbi:hypothetical protein [Paenibacillus massiliensis]|uniref:hypothetical protein n=1 Tax=Paenibacillus massiliensis TaxID=225917 RepID=UPI000490E7D0|nr:hypothetical protein [Paenibacillus massiliensis]